MWSGWRRHEEAATNKPFPYEISVWWLVDDEKYGLEALKDSALRPADEWERGQQAEGPASTWNPGVSTP